MQITDLSGNGVVDGILRLRESSREKPFNETYPVTPSDSVNIRRHGQDDPARALIIGSAGNLNYIPAGQADAVLVAVAVGVFPVSVKRVLATSTTASGILAGY